jgi:hypothetical protein
MAFNFDAAGKATRPSDEELAKSDEYTSILVFIHGAMADGRPYYAYVAVKPSKYKEFSALTANKQNFVINDYGKVLMCGYTYDPPPRVVERMRKEYGFDEHYVEKLTEQANNQQKQFFEKQEVSRIDNIVAMLKKKNPDGSTT